ncbi:hypothetical protein [Serratia silvae]|uniref:Uncharacterized protein n=1 Tax=Serratia silvae TaxID=2824122 RepID=A0ABT0KCN9_9GAMM|nr:hypothetical protein [Serratia silvae]MCL1029775.1 hypothetical protein [Serratia silvae]
MVLLARAVQKQKVVLEKSTLKAMNRSSVHIISVYSLVSTGTEVSTINMGLSLQSGPNSQYPGRTWYSLD